MEEIKEEKIVSNHKSLFAKDKPYSRSQLYIAEDE